jgi:hypothetical protein
LRPSGDELPLNFIKGCVHSNKNAVEYQESLERNTSPIARLMQFYLRSRLVGTCVADFADKNERLIAADQYILSSAQGRPGQLEEQLPKIAEGAARAPSADSPIDVPTAPLDQPI